VDKKEKVIEINSFSPIASPTLPGPGYTILDFETNGPTLEPVDKKGAQLYP